MRDAEGPVGDRDRLRGATDGDTLTVGCTLVFGPHSGRDEIALRSDHAGTLLLRPERAAYRDWNTTDRNARRVQKQPAEHAHTVKRPHNRAASPQMSGPFDEKLTDEQREAAALRYLDTEDTGREVARKAGAGELTLRGEPVDAFDIAPSYAAQLGLKLKRQRTGKATSKVADMPHRDALEVLRRRLMSVGESAVAALEKQAAKDAEKLDLERLRQAGRVLIELGKIPGPAETRPAQQGRDVNGNRDTPTRGGIAGALLREHRASAEPAQDEAHSRTDSGDSTATHNTDVGLEAQQHDEPGALSSEQSAEQRALAVGG